MAEIINMYEKIIDVKLPSFINKILENGEINNTINFIGEEDEIENDFDFYENDNNEILFSWNICFSLEEINTLIKNMDKYKENLLKN